MFVGVWVWRGAGEGGRVGGWGGVGGYGMVVERYYMSCNKTRVSVDLVSTDELNPTCRMFCLPRGPR